MNYEEQSDFEINKAVAEALGHSPTYRQSYIPAVCIDAMEASFDYCNNPSDAWPIITENKISIEYTGDDIWGAIGSDGGMFSCSNCADKNPLRAAMIVFLKMEQEK